MSRLLAHLWRFAVVIAGFGLSCLAASFFLHLLLLGGVRWMSGGQEDAFILFSVTFVALMIAYLAFFPALIIIVVAESLGRRDWLFFAISGGALAALLSAFALSVRNADGPFMPSMVAAGIVAGIVYWAVAGRSAGRSLDRLVSGREPSES